jgi:hypothetical protein
MTAPRDPDRMIHHFLMEGGEQLHDQVYDAVRAEIDVKRQRVFIGPWRLPTMNKLVPIGLGAAAVVVVLVVGASVLRAPAPGGVGAGPTAAPSPSAAAPTTASSPSAAAPSTAAAAGLPVAGSHVLWSEGGVEVTVTIPAPGWTGEDAGGILVKNDSVDPPAGAGMIVFASEGLFVYGDPCRWSSTTPATPVTTVDALVTALAAQASRDASAPVDITVDGHAGKSITLNVPGDADFSACDQGFFGSWGVATERTPARYHQGPGQIDELWILDVDGDLVVIDTTYYAGTPAEHVAEIRAIVESATFK